MDYQMGADRRSEAGQMRVLHRGDGHKDTSKAILLERKLLGYAWAQSCKRRLCLAGGGCKGCLRTTRPAHRCKP